VDHFIHIERFVGLDDLLRAPDVRIDWRTLKRILIENPPRDVPEAIFMAATIAAAARWINASAMRCFSRV
jgi:hypothetical protein